MNTRYIPATVVLICPLEGTLHPDPLEAAGLPPTKYDVSAVSVPVVMDCVAPLKSE